MSSQEKNTALLPSGFEDLLMPHAEHESKAIERIMSVFSAFGYRRIKPPIAEYEETMLVPGPGAFLADVTFRMVDPQSGKMLCLRSDITAQIARIARTRLSEEPRALRVAYANDVLRTRASQQRTTRQFAQVGCEMIGQDDVQSDIEVAVIALKAASELGLKQVTMDFALPRIFDAALEASGVALDQIDALRAKVSGRALEALEALKKLGLNDEAQAQVQRLEQVVRGVNEAVVQLGLDNVSLTLDPLETKGFEYHNGVAFTLFSHGVRGEIGRGGRYDIHAGVDQKESAMGVTFYMDTIRQGIEFEDGQKLIAVSSDIDWSELSALQQEGFVILRGSSVAGATHKYIDGEIKEI